MSIKDEDDDALQAVVKVKLLLRTMEDRSRQAADLLVKALGIPDDDTGHPVAGTSTLVTLAQAVVELVEQQQVTIADLKAQLNGKKEDVAQ